MPDIDIYVESSFFATSSGTIDTRALFTLKESDSIGQRDTITNYTTAPGISGVISTPVYVNFDTTQSGFSSTAATLETQEATYSGTETCLVDYAMAQTTSGTEDFDLEYFTGTSKISGSINAYIKYTAGEAYDYSSDVAIDWRTYTSYSGTYDYEIDYTAGGHYDPLIPGPPEDQVIISGTIDTGGLFTTAEDDDDGAIAAYCDVSFVGYPMEFFPEKYTYKFNLVAGIEGENQGTEWETTVISGSVIDVPFDLYSTTVVSGYHNTDEVCGLVDLVSYAFESETVSGTIGYYNYETICAVSGTNGHGFDIDLLSLKISNFSLDVDEYTVASGSVCVDLTDDVYNVVISGSYFIVDGVVVSGTSYIPITDGYTMCYDSPTDFDDLLGSTTITVHTENDDGDILEQDFYLTSGYIVEYDNRIQDYGFNSQVVVRGTAENLASCPDTGADAYFFTTVPKYGVDLGATIVGQPWGEKDLGASIFPTTDTIYFYGKTFRVEVRSKDFAGNVMEPFTFQFRIEDEPE